MLLDRALAHPQAQLAQLALDALGAPQAVIRRHLLDERRGLRRQLRLGRGRSRLALPEEAEALPMPPQHRLRLYDDQGLRPGAELAGQQHDDPAVEHGEAGTLGPPAEDQHLLAQ
jgi:hypothetical protein